MEAHQDRQEPELRMDEGGGEKTLDMEEMKALIQQLQNENAKVKQEKSALEEENAKVKHEKSALEEENAKVKQESAKKDQKIESLDYTGSVKEMLDIHRGIPALEMNTAATPSVRGALVKVDSSSCNKKRKREVPQRAAALEATEKNAMLAIADEAESNGPKHAPASMEGMEVLSVIQEFSVNLFKKNGDLVKSSVGLDLDEQGTDKEAELSNFNEASVSAHVSNILKDVLRCQHLLSTTQVGQEISLFSMRPDIVVVRWKTSIILVVEVKNPGEDGCSVVHNEYAAGQAYDYAMGMRQMGIDHPFVCLSTYDHMRIGTLARSSSSVFTKARDLLKKYPIGDERVLEQQTPKKNKPTPSPEKTGNLTSVIPNDDNNFAMQENDLYNGNATNEDQEEVDRVIYFSEVFDRTNIFQALYFAIACGVLVASQQHSANNNNRNQALVPEESERIQRCVAVVQKNSVGWKTLNCSASYQLKNRTWRDKMKASLHCVLGQGGCGKVYLGSDETGGMFAVKLYLYDSETMRSFRAKNNNITKETQKQRLQGIRNREASAWGELYPEYKASIFEGELLGVSCLGMPYVASIPMSRRKELLSKIHAELKRSAGKGYVYKESELRWRHIGLRQARSTKHAVEKKIVLIDLESMVYDKDRVVQPDFDSAISELSGRAEQEPVNAPQDLIHP